MSETTAPSDQQSYGFPATVDGKVGAAIDGRPVSTVVESGPVEPDPTKNRKRLVWPVVGLLVLSTAVVVGLSLSGDEPAEAVIAAPPATSEVQVRDLAETEEYVGQLQYGDARSMFAASSGYLTALVDEGDIVERGEVLYRLSNDPDEAALLGAEQEVASAQSQLANANAQRSSLTAGASASELSSAEASMAQAQLSLEQMLEPATQAELATAQAHLSQAEEAYSVLFSGPTSSELAALQGDVSRAQLTLEQASAERDNAWISLLSAQSSYCGLSPVPVGGLCGPSDIPLSDSAVASLTAAVQSALAAGDGAAVDAIQSLISASSSYKNANGSVFSAATSLSTAQTSLSEASASPSQVSIDQALAAVYQAQESLQFLVEGPSALELAEAEASLSSAQARLQELLAGATASERQAAAAAVESAAIALEITRLEMSELVAAPTAVTLLYGEDVSWRTLELGASPGSDVRQLEENLVALGFDTAGAVVVDEIFDEATEQAVTAWQESLGNTADGSVSAAELVYAPGPVNAGPRAEGVELGMVVNAGEMLVDLVPVSRIESALDGASTVESMHRIVLSLPIDDRDLVEEGSQVMVELADGTELVASVDSIGAPVTGESGSTVEVLIVPSQAIDDAWTGTNVTVNVTTDLVEQVMAVPVSALLALVEGGYAVEVLEADGSTHLLAVETGIFADGAVEISGQGLSAGMNVVVPG